MAKVYVGTKPVVLHGHAMMVDVFVISVGLESVECEAVLKVNGSSKGLVLDVPTKKLDYITSYDLMNGCVHAIRERYKA